MKLRNQKQKELMSFYQLQVERDVLAEAVAWAARTLPTRPAQPMLAGLLIEAAVKLKRVVGAFTLVSPSFR